MLSSKISGISLDEFNFRRKSIIRTFALMLRYILVFSILLPLLAFISCRQKNTASEKMQLTVSIIPQKYLASYIAGDKFEIQVMLPGGSNHETYEPAPRDMEKISLSKLYLALGSLDFELAWLDRLKASNPDMMVINTGRGIEMIKGHSHNTDNKAEPETAGIDPHTWLSPSCMKIQAANICNALSIADKANSDFYKYNLLKFNLMADSVDSIIHKKLDPLAGKSILIFHPSLAYFARDYKLKQISIELEGKEPSAAYLGKLVKIAKQEGIKAIFISKEFDTRHAEAIAREIGGKVMVFDPMAENWKENLVLLADLIAEN
jgi:zinc transport system substrate-binding protein